jgi:hypothetical protein
MVPPFYPPPRGDRSISFIRTSLLAGQLQLKPPPD